MAEGSSQFMDQLRGEVERSLPSLEHDRVEGLLSLFEEYEVQSWDDFKDFEATEFMEFLSIFQAKRLLKKIQQRALAEPADFEGSSTNSHTPDVLKKVVEAPCVRSPDGTGVSGLRNTYNFQDSQNATIIGGDIHSRETTIITGSQDEDFTAEIDTVIKDSVKTPALDRVLEKLQKTRFAVITGCPGSGKTVLAHMTLKAMAEKGYVPKILRFQHDFTTNLFQKEKLLIFVDDIFGQICFDQSSLTSMDRLLELLKTMVEKEKLTAICTSRLNILKEAEPFLEKNQHLFGHKSRIDLTNQEFFPFPVMRKMLLKHIEGSKVKLSRSVLNSIIQSYNISEATHGFPHCCALLVASEQAQRNPKYFFDHPIKTMKETLSAIMSRKDSYKTFFEFMIRCKGVLDLDSLENENDDFKEDDLERISDEMDGTFLRKEKNLIRFKHPSLYECTAAIIGKNKPKFVLEYASLEYISYHVIVKDDEKGEDDSIDLTLSTRFAKHIQKRFVAEIKQEHFSLLFRHHLWKDKDFTISAIDAVVKECGEDLMITFKGSRTSLLHWSARSRTSIILQYALEQFHVGEELKLDALYGCLVWSNVEGFEFILTKLHPSVVKRKFDGKSAIAHVAGSGTVEMVKALIAHDIDIHAKDDSGVTAVHLAAAVGNIAILKTLIDAECDINARTDGNATPLHFAVLNHLPQTVKYLIEANCKIDVNAENICGVDPRRREIYIDHQTAYPLYFEGTPLYFACITDDHQIAKILLDNGADVDIANQCGATPLHVCLHEKHLNCLRLLLQRYESNPEMLEKLFTYQQHEKLNSFEFLTGTTSEIFGKIPEVIMSYMQSPFDFAFLSGSLKTLLEFFSLKPELKKWVVSFKDSQDCLIVDDIDLHDPFPNDYTFLHLVVLSGNLEMVRDLLKCPGTDVNACSKNGTTPLHAAIMTGNVGMVSLLKDAGADVNMPSPLWKMSTLSLAAFKGDIDVLEYLLDNSVDIDEQIAPFGVTALSMATMLQKYEIVDFLIKRGADVNVESMYKVTALNAAVMYGAGELVDVLIKHQASVNIINIFGQSPLITATFYDHEKIVCSLIKAGAEVNYQEETEHSSPLHVASRFGYHNSAKLLLDAKADPNLADEVGDTPLTVVATSGHEIIFKLLLESGANINHQNEKGETSLMKAIQGGHSIIARQLVLHSATDIYLHDMEHGYTALHHACSEGQTDIVELILKKNPSAKTHLKCPSSEKQSELHVNLPTEYGVTPLYIASKIGYTDIVQCLIGAGANVNIDLIEGKTPLMISSQYRHAAVVECLLQDHADANLQDDSGCTALHWACSGSHEIVVQILLNRKAHDNKNKESSAEWNVKIDVENQEGNTPLILAAITGNLNIVIHLLESGANADIINRQGQSALTAAIHAGCNFVVDTLFNASGLEIKEMLQAFSLVKLAEGNVIIIIKHLLDSGTDVNTRDQQGKTALLVAVEHEHLELMDILLETSADVNAPDEHGITPLFAAAKLGSKVIVERLINKNAEIDVIWCNGQTPLNASAECGHADVVEVIIQSHADVNIVDFDGFTALTRAVSEGHENIFHMIVEKSVHLNLDAVMISVASSGNLKMLHLLLEKGADINYMMDDDQTPLMVAITKGHVALAEILINHPEINLTLVDKNKNKALHYACRHGQTELVHMILLKDSLVDVVATNDGTPLLIASYKGYTTIVQYLLKASADPNLKSEYGFTPLHSAARMGHCEIVCLLIKSKADINTNFVEGRTPLIVASMRGHISVVECLLAAGADALIQDDEGLTALHWACSGKHMGVVELLLTRISNEESEACETVPKLDVNVQCRNGNTPLILATKANAEEIVMHLIEFGAVVDTRNNEGQSAMTEAISYGFVKIVEIFVNSCTTDISDSIKDICLVKLAENNSIDNSSIDIIKRLVQGGVSVNTRNETGKTPLIAAVERGDIGLIAFLLDASADVNIADHHGKTPLYAAAKLGNRDIVELLVEHDAEIDVILQNGRTPLNVSAENGHVDVVKFLIQRRANVNTVDFEGRTPLARAAYKGHTDIVLDLLHAGIDAEGMEVAINSSRSDEITDILFNWLCM